MTVVTSEARLAGSGVALLPRVNLLPPEIAEQATFRKIQAGLGAALLASVGVVALLVTSAAGGVADAQADLDQTNARNASLRQQTAKLQDVTAVYARAAAAQAQLSSAMGDEIRFSQVLNDLSLAIPSNVWLKSVSYSSGATAAGVGTTGQGVGSLSATAIAFSHDDVAVWLESIAGLKTYTNPYFSSSTEGLIGTRKVVNFTSTATLTQAAQSGRYNRPVGG